MYQSHQTAFMQPINTTTFENGLQLHTVIIKNERKRPPANERFSEV